MMNKIILTAIAAMMTTSVSAAPLTDFFYANGYTKPSESIVEIQAKVDSGVYYNYPYVVGGGVEKGLFKKYLKDGTVLPQIMSVTALKKALDKKQVVLVASAGSDVSTAALPIFVEIAKQNGVSTIDLMAHLTINQLDGEDFFSNIDDVLSTVDAKIDEITAELNDDVSEEISAEITAEIVEEVTKEITEEVTQEITDVVSEEVAEEISISIEDALSEVGYSDDDFAAGFDELVSEINENLGAAARHVNADLIAGQAIAAGINRDLGTEFTAQDVVNAVHTVGG